VAHPAEAVDKFHSAVLQSTSKVRDSSGSQNPKARRARRERLWKDLDLHQPSFGAPEAQPQAATDGGSERRSLDLTAQTSRWVEKQRTRNDPPGLSVAVVAEAVQDQGQVDPDHVVLHSDKWKIIGGDTGEWLQGVVVRSHRFWPWWGLKLVAGATEGDSRRDVAKELIVVAVWNLAGAFAKHPSLDPVDYVLPVLALASSLAQALCGVDHPLTSRILAKLRKTVTVAARGLNSHLPLAVVDLPESSTPRRRRPATASATVSSKSIADRTGFAVQLSRMDASALQPVAQKRRCTPRSDSPTTVGSRPTTAQSLATDRADTLELSRPGSGSERRGRHHVGPLPNHSCVARGFRLLEPLRLCSDRSFDTGGPGIAAGTTVVGMPIGEWIRVTGIGPSAGDVGFVPAILDGRSVVEPDELPEDAQCREEEERRSRLARVQRLRLAIACKVSVCTHSRTGMGNVSVGSVGAVSAVLPSGEVTIDFPAEAGWIADPRDLSVVPVERPRSGSRRKHTPRQLWRVTSPNPDRGPAPPAGTRESPRTSSPWIRNVTGTVAEGRKTILALMGAQTSDPAALEAQISLWTPQEVGETQSLRDWQAEQLKQRHRFEHTVAYVGRLMDAASHRQPRRPCADRSVSPAAEPPVYRSIVPVGSPHPIGAADRSGFVAKVRTPFRVFNEIEVTGSVLPPHRRKHLQKLRAGAAPQAPPAEPAEPEDDAPPAPHRARTEAARFASSAAVVERRRLGTTGALRAATTDPSVQ